MAAAQRSLSWAHLLGRMKKGKSSCSQSSCRARHRAVQRVLLMGSSLLMVTLHTAVLPCNTHCWASSSIVCAAKVFQANRIDSSTFCHSFITEYSTVNLVRKLQSLSSSGEFSPLFPKKSFWMCCQECVFSVMFQVA